MHILLLNIEQQVDGGALIMLAKHGSMEQLQACGFKTVKEQLILKKLVSEEDETSVSKAGCTLSTNDHKLTISEMKQMKDEEKYMYLIKYVSQHVKLIFNIAKTFYGKSYPVANVFNAFILQEKKSNKSSQQKMARKQYSHF